MKIIPLIIALCILSMNIHGQEQLVRFSNLHVDDQDDTLSFLKAIMNTQMKIRGLKDRVIMFKLILSSGHWVTSINLAPRIMRNISPRGITIS